MISPEILRRYPFFGALSDAQIKAIAMIAEEEQYAKGAVICEEGQPAKAFYLLLEGGVCLYYKSEEEWIAAHPDREFPREEADVIIAKHRNGPTGRVKLRFRQNLAKFESLGSSEPMLQ